MQPHSLARTEPSLEEVKRQFDSWRRGHDWRGRIPNNLWRMAARTAVVHGVDRTASELRLNPDRLKQWMRMLDPVESIGEVPRFVELSPLTVAPTAECSLELEDGSGKKLRIILKGQATAQAVALGRTLWKDES